MANMHRTPGAESDPGAARDTSSKDVSSTLYHPPNTRVCYFYKDGDTNHQPVRINVNPRHFVTLDRLALELQRKVRGMPNGVRSIYTPGGNDRIQRISELQNDGRYVVSTHRNKAKGVDIARVHNRRPWRTGRPPSARKKYAGFLSESQVAEIDHSPPRSKKAWDAPARKPLYAVQPPKKIEVIRNGDPSQKHVILLNRRTAQTFEQVLEDLGQMFQMPARKMFTLQGRAVKSLSGIFNGPDMYVISRGERFIPMGALSDPGILAPGPESPLKRRKGYAADPVAAKIKNKRARLSRTKGKWKVWVTTNDHPAAGTHAQITLTAYGHKGNSGPIPLGYADGETFQAGNIDEFEVSVGNIGEIFKVRIAHDNTGDKPGWLLDEVRMKDVHTEEQLVFKCKRWLSRDEDDLEICRELPAVREKENPLPITQYEVRVHTGEVWNGGTDANVYITIYGEKGDTGVRQLIKSNMADMFAKGNEDVFIMEAVSLGNLKRVIMGHDGTGPGQGWFLESVDVREMPRGVTWHFPCDKWLDEDEDDAKIVRELKVQDQYVGDILDKAMSGEYWDYEKWKFSEHTQVLFYSKSTQLPLRIKQDGSVDANGDYVDTFGVLNVLGKKAMIRTLQCASNPKFHLAIDNGKVMGLGKGGAYCEFKIRVQKDRSVLLESNKYPLQFINIQANGKPGDPRSADLNDTAKHFYVYPKGIFRDQGVIVFNTSLKQTLNIDHDDTLFATGKRNRVAQFKVHKVKGQGKVRMFESITFPGQFIQLQGGAIDVKGKGDKNSEFKVKRVKDQCYASLESVASPGINLGMTKDGKVRPTVDTGDKNTRFYPEVVTWGTPRSNVFSTEIPEEAPVESKPKPRKPRKTPIPEEAAPSTPVRQKTQYDDGDWKLLIATEETAANGRVVLVVYGNDGNSGEIILGESNKNGMFQAGNQDQFKINLLRVGSIFKVRVELHPVSEDTEPSWRIKEAKLQDTQTKETLKFKFNTLLARQSGDGTLMFEMPAVRPAQDVLPVVRYKIAVETGNEPGADTDAHVYVTLFGERGDSGKRRLVHSDQSRKFQQGQTDTFEIAAVSLGELKSCVIGHDGQASGEGWKCECVRVRENDAQPVYFPCNKWLDISVGDKKIERVLKPAEEPKARSPTPKPETPVVREKTQEETTEEKEEEKEKFNDGDYQVWITTGPEDNMATANNVILVAYGDKKKSEELQLDKSLLMQTDDGDQTLFQKSQTDEFKVNLGADIGDLYKVRIGHSDEDRQSGWFVEKIKMKNLVTEELFTFKVNRWMSRLEEDNDVWRELPVISPGKQPLPVLPYIVEIYTGNEPGSDTEANIYLQLIGKRGDSGKRVLFNSISDLKFQQGQCDVFRVEAVTLDEVTQVVVGHDGKGKGAGWFCERVVVKEGPNPDAEAYYFPCSRWLDVGQDDEQIERVLERGEPPKESQGAYLVWVKTAADSNPPNSSLATITAYGEKGRSKEIELSLEGSEGFQPSSTDQFEIAVGDIGELYKIRVARKFDDTWEGWHLDEVKMQDKDTEETHTFKFDCWLDLYKSDHDLAREKPVAKEGTPELPIQTYELCVYTGDHWAAQTDANVHVTLFGSRGDSGKRYLHHPADTQTKFCKNQMDTFMLEAVTLENLERIIVGHDGVGHGAGWFLEKIVIRERDGENSEKEFIFPCCQWLDDHEGDGKTERELKVLDVKDKGSELAPAAQGVKTGGKWEVTVTTSDVTNAETHAAVFVMVYGEKGKSDALPLGTADPQSDQFERGKESKFNISVGDIGELYKVRIEHDNTHSFPAWHLQQLFMKDEATGEEQSWYVNRWLGEEEEDGALCRELAVSKPEQPTPPVLRYYVATYTANVRNAGTNAKVKATLFGSHGDTGVRALTNSRTRQHPFLQGHIDVFTIEAVSLGQVQTLLLEHDGTDAESAWFVDKVMVKESEAALYEYSFPCQAWVEPTLDTAASLTLTTTGLQLATPLPSEEAAILKRDGAQESSGDWVVWTYTGVHEETATDTGVHVVLCGTEATSPKLPLKYQGEEDGEVISKRFLPGATDVFRVAAGEIGELMKIRVFINPEGNNPNWYLEKMKLKDIRTKQEFHFKHAQWIRKEEGVAEEMIMELPCVRPDLSPLEPKLYQVAVTTGDELRAETSAEIYCILIGQFGDTGRRLLLKAKERETEKFRRNQTDIFELPAVDLGPLRMVIIGHDLKGRGKGWLCDRVVVSDNPDAQSQTVFPCSQWLDTGIGDRKLERVLLPSGTIAVPADDEPADAAAPPSEGKYKAFITSGGAPNSNTNQNSEGNSNANNNGDDKEGDLNINNNNTGDSGECVEITEEHVDDPTETAEDSSTEIHECSSEHLSSQSQSVENCHTCASQVTLHSGIDSEQEQFLKEFYSDLFIDQPAQQLTHHCVTDLVDNSDVTPQLLTHSCHKTNSDVQLEIEYNSYCCCRSISNTSQMDYFHSQPHALNTHAHTHISPDHRLVCNLSMNNHADRDDEEQISFCNLNINNHAQTNMAEQAASGSDGVDELELRPRVVTIMVYGSKEVAGPIELNNGDQDMFSPGKCDEFDLHVGDVGEIYKVRVTNALDRPWGISELILLDVSTKDKLIFDFSKFIGLKDGDIRKELPVIKPNQSVLPVLIYRVTIETMATPTADAQTDVECPDVFIRLFGERGDSGSRHLNKLDPEGTSMLIQQGITYTFMLEAVDLSCVTKVLITKARGPLLSIKEVRVKKAEFAPEEWVFSYEDSIEDNEETVSRQVVIEQSEARPCDTAISLDLCPDLPKSAGVWNLWTVTGSEEEHGCAAEVKLTMCGSQGESPDIPLKLFESDDRPFKKGANDHFVFQLKPDIGELEKVRLAFTEPDKTPSWFIESMRFEDQDTGDEFCIDVDDWLRVDENEDGVREYPIIWPGVTPKPFVKYHVKTYTGDRNNAGTNSNVFISLHGSSASSGRRALKKAKNNMNKFEQGQMDKFILEVGDLGDIEKVIIGHDGNGIGAGWFLDKVIIKVIDSDDDEEVESDAEEEEPKTEDDETAKKKKFSKKYIFPCERWLDVGEDDNAIERELIKAEKEKTKVDGEPWKITVTTADEANASTDERVSLVIYGKNGKSQRLHLGDKGDMKNQGEMSAYEMLVKPDLGTIYKVRVGFGNVADDATTWKLDMVLLENLKSGEKYEFLHGDWVSVTDESDGWVEIPVLKPNSAEMLPVLTYTVRVQTGDVRGAGTDADVYLKLIGQRGDTGKRHLKQSIKDKHNKFEQGAVDKFEIRAVELGDIERVLVGHTSDGIGAGWYLHNVLVKCEEGEETQKFYFYCDRWLDMSEDDGKIERELELTDPPSTPAPAGTKWSVTIRNGSDISSKGNDSDEENEDKEKEKKDKGEEEGVQGDVSIVVYGENGKTDALQLPSANQLRFMPTQTETYQVVMAEDVGEIYKIRLHVSSEEKLRWPVEYVVLQQEGSERQLRFEMNDEVVFNKRHDGCREAAVCSAESDDGAVVPSLPVHRYNVEVYTGDKSGSGTDANVYIEISGSRGDTGERKLLKSQTNKKMFEQDQKDVFSVEAVDLGDLVRMRVGHDGKGFGSGWYLNKVIVKQSEDALKEYIFQCDRWLDEGEDDNEIERVLELTEVKEKEGAAWKVVLTTGEPKAAEGDENEAARQVRTDGQLVLAVYGDQCGSADYQLTNSEDINTSGNQLEVDLPLTEEIGMPFKVRLGFAGGTAAEQAYLVQSLKLLEVATGTEYVFENTAEAWLLVDEEHEGWLEVPVKPTDDSQPLPVLKYHVEVYTGDKMGAGTDSHVYACIVGERGDTGRRPLKLSRTYGKDAFEQDHMDLFELEAVQLLNPEKVIIGHDRSGSGWYLDKVVIKEARNAKKEFLFPCDHWLSDSEGDNLTERELTVKPPEGRPWTITTVTGKSSGDSGSDSNRVPGPALLVLYGEKGRSKPMQFGDDMDFHFEEDQTQEFLVHACNETSDEEDLGALYKVRVSLDPAADLPEEGFCWNLDKITLKDESSGIEYTCELAGRKVVLSKKNDSLTEIPVSGDAMLPLHDYFVEVHTADVAGAGTDARVTMQITGARGDTGVRQLIVSSTEGQKFEKGEMDIFTVPAVDLGALTSLRVGHDGKGIGSGWKLDKVIIKEQGSASKAFHFECDKWLDEGEDDGTIERDFELTKVVEEGEGEDPPKPGDWRVLITSGDKESRGETNAQVHVQVFGEAGDSGPMPLGEPGQNLFQADCTDQFEIFINPQDVGKLRKLRIWHDDTGEHPGWFIQKVSMEDLAAGTVLEMPVNRWLHKKKEDGDIVREIPVIWPGEEPLPVTVYDVEVMTGQKWGGGTDAHPFIILQGEKGDSGRRVLSKNKEGGDMFENGKTDTFSIEAVDLGDLKSIHIGHDRDGGGAGWFLDRVLIRPGQDADHKLVFPCSNWLDKDEGDRQTERTLQLDGTEPIEEGDWRILISTGNEQSEGSTTSQVCCQLYGDTGDSGPIPLADTDQGLFQAGSTDLFEMYFEPEEIGKMTKFVFWHDNTGDSPGWYLDKIVLHHVLTNQIHEILVGKWFDAKRDDKMIERDIPIYFPEDWKGPK